MTAEQVTRPRQDRACGVMNGDVITCAAGDIRDATVTHIQDHHPALDEITLGLEWERDGRKRSRVVSVKRSLLVTVASGAGEPAPPDDEAAGIREAQRGAARALFCLTFAPAWVPALAWTVDDMTGLLSAQAHTSEAFQAWARFLGAEPRTSGGFTDIDAKDPTYGRPVHIWMLGGQV